MAAAVPAHILLHRHAPIPQLPGVVAAKNSQLSLLRTAKAGLTSPLGISLKPKAKVIGKAYRRPALSSLGGTNSVEPLTLQSCPQNQTE